MAMGDVPVNISLKGQAFRQSSSPNFLQRTPMSYPRIPPGARNVCRHCLFSFGLSRESLSSVLLSNPGILELWHLGKIEAVFDAVKDFDNYSTIMRSSGRCWSSRKGSRLNLPTFARTSASFNIVDIWGVLQLGIEDRLKPLFSELWELGFGFLEIKKAAFEDPQIFQIEAGRELSRCVNLLKNLKCRLLIKEKILDNGMLRASIEVKLRVGCLCRSGLIHRDVFKLLGRDSRIIAYDLADIQNYIKIINI